MMVIAIVVLAWCLVPIPLAVAVGRMLRRGRELSAEPITLIEPAPGAHLTMRDELRPTVSRPSAPTGL